MTIDSLSKVASQMEDGPDQRRQSLLLLAHFLYGQLGELNTDLATVQGTCVATQVELGKGIRDKWFKTDRHHTWLNDLSDAFKEYEPSRETAMIMIGSLVQEYRGIKNEVADLIAQLRALENNSHPDFLRDVRLGVDAASVRLTSTKLVESAKLQEMYAKMAGRGS
jgi:hypothetical protein